MNKPLPDWLKDRLPNYKNIDSIPQAFNDSTHKLWRLQRSGLDKKNHFLKVCNNTESPFWQIMHELFDFELRAEIASFSDTYSLINKASSLAIPELIKAEALVNDNAYILTSELTGSVLDSNINDELVKQLADHLLELHSNPSSKWGKLNKPKFNSFDWTNRIEATLLKSTQKWGGVILESDNYLKQALSACALIKTSDFVPMIPDLRWDQFLQKDNLITALVDLDAFVFAPRELDFVILEYLLSPSQIRIFSKVYSKQLTIPEVEIVRPAYRLLLFYMKILGEKDLDTWMNKEAMF